MTWSRAATAAANARASGEGGMQAVHENNVPSAWTYELVKYQIKRDSGSTDLFLLKV